MNANQFDRIDQYLRGDLNAADMKEFEASLSSDPALSDEFSVQQEIVEGIRSYRKAQLKQQLSQVALPEHGGWQVAGLKGLVGAAVTSAVLVGAWYFGADTDPQESSAMIAMEGPAYRKQEVTLPEINPVEKIAFVPISEAPAVREEVAMAEPEIEESVSQPAFEANIVLPEDQSGAAEAEFVPEQVSEELRSANLKPTTKVLQVDNFDTESDELRYEYFDGKLALYGNFGQSPYQILEINQNGAKRLFLFHEDAYYAITNTSKPLPLVRIDDPEMIEELDIFKGE
ncbi:MAG: hypothetical protein AAGA85_01115 [Bacteroidota bacterium]